MRTPTNPTPENPDEGDRLPRPQGLPLRKRQGPELQAPTDALVRITRSAICGSDLHLWHGLPAPESGFAVGHEFVGVIEEAGAGVQGLNRGAPSSSPAQPSSLGTGVGSVWWA
ncbi:MAG: alcohol dehydrogenase catalytic domain-containing protein [Myxococcota bacterium]